MDIPNDNRVAHRILRHISAIAMPRFPGTAGERNAQTYVRGMLEAVGYAVMDMEFTSSLFPFEVLPRLAAALATAMLVIAYACIPNIPVLSIELSVLVLLMLLGLSRWSPLVERLYRLRRFGRVRSSNLLGVHPHKSEHMNVVFMAHYDSKSQLLSGPMRFASHGALAILSVLSAILIIVVIPTGWPRELVLLSLLPVSLIALVLQVNGTANGSPGAYDNASGVGVLLELASAYADATPTCNLAFIATGAEEAGLCGAVALAGSEWFTRMYPPGRTVIINIDGVGSKGPLTITDRIGIPPVRTGRLITDLCLKVADRFGVETRTNWLPGGAGMDHVPFAAHGYETITLSTAGWDRAFRSMHTGNDIIDHLDPASLENCYAVCSEVLDSIPRVQMRQQASPTAG